MAERVGAVSSRPNRGRLSRYEVKRAIGKGSYGEVFLVTYRGDGKQVGSRARPTMYCTHGPRASFQGKHLSSQFLM